MAHSEARAWWADVQHLRDGYERTDEARRRADEADLAARRAIRERRGVEAEVSSLLSAPRRSPRRVSGPELTRVSGPELASRRVSGPEPAQRRAPEPELAGRRSGGHEHAAGRDTAAPSPAGQRVKGGATPGRRTIEIRGRTVPAPTVPRPVATDRRRPPRRAVERVGGRPDRVAMWALLMGLLLILVAIGTADSSAAVALVLR